MAHIEILKIVLIRLSFGLSLMRTLLSSHCMLHLNILFLVERLGKVFLKG